MITWIKQLFCWHNYKMHKEFPLGTLFKCTKCSNLETRELADFY